MATGERVPPILRALTSSEATWMDPSEDLLFELLSDMERGDEEFLIIERTADESGQTYAQVIVDGGRWRLERREGSAEQHFVGFVDDKRAAHQVLTAWAFMLGPTPSDPVWTKLDP